MKVTFANPFLKERCKILAGMEPDKWHHRGNFQYAITGGDVMPNMVRHGFLERRRNTQFSQWFYEYRLTPLGMKFSAHLRNILPSRREQIG